MPAVPPPPAATSPRPPLRVVISLEPEEAGLFRGGCGVRTVGPLPKLASLAPELRLPRRAGLSHSGRGDW